MTSAPTVGSVDEMTRIVHNTNETTTNPDTTTLLKETAKKITNHEYGPGLSSDTTEENKETQSNGPTSANIEPADSGYFTAGTTETSPENNPIIVNENLTNNRKDMTSTPTVGSVNAMTRIVYNTNETTINPDTIYVATMSDRTGMEYETNLTHETATTVYEPDWMSDRNGVTSTEVPTQRSEKERFQVMKILHGNR